MLPGRFMNLGTNQSVFRSLLQKEFVRRCDANRNYSMRSFAQSLDIDQSLLSKILRGKRSISRNLVVKLSPRLGMKPSQLEDISELKKTDSKQMSDDQFSFISEWIHFALLELAKTKSFKSDETQIADQLKVHPELVRAAVERLKRLGFIIVKNKKWTLLSPNNKWVENEFTTMARRNLQKTYLQKSIEAIETVDFSDRDNGSITIAISKKRLDEIRKEIKKFRENLSEIMQKDEDELDQVYQFTTSFFPLTDLKKGTK